MKKKILNECEDKKINVESIPLDFNQNDKIFEEKLLNYNKRQIIEYFVDLLREKNTEINQY